MMEMRNTGFQAIFIGFKHKPKVKKKCFKNIMFLKHLSFFLLPSAFRCGQCLLRKSVSTLGM